MTNRIHWLEAINLWQPIGFSPLYTTIIGQLSLVMHQQGSRSAIVLELSLEKRRSFAFISAMERNCSIRALSETVSVSDLQRPMNNSILNGFSKMKPFWNCQFIFFLKKSVLNYTSNGSGTWIFGKLYASDSILNTRHICPGVNSSTYRSCGKHLGPPHCIGIPVPG